MSGRSRGGSSGVPVGGGGPKPVGLGIPEGSHCSHSEMPVAGQEASGNARESSGNAGWLPATPGASGNGHVLFPGNTARPLLCCAGLLGGCNPGTYGPPGGWAAQRWGKLGFRLSATKPGFPPLAVQRGVGPVLRRDRRVFLGPPNSRFPPTHPTERAQGTREREGA